MGAPDDVHLDLAGVAALQRVHPGVDGVQPVVAGPGHRRGRGRHQPVDDCSKENDKFL